MSTNKIENFKLYAMWGLLALFILNAGVQVVSEIFPNINSAAYWLVAIAFAVLVRSGLLDGLVTEEEYYE